MSEFRDFICPDIQGRPITPEQAQQMAEVKMTMDYRIDQAVQDGLLTYDEVADYVDQLIASRRLG